MREYVRFFGFAMAAWLAVATMQAALDRGAIQGTVTDPQGAAVPAVEVTVTNTATNVSTKVSTNTAGFYLVRSWCPAHTRCNSGPRASARSIFKTSR